MTHCRVLKLANRPSRRSMAVATIALESASAQKERATWCEGNPAVVLLEGRVRSNIAVLLALSVQLGVGDVAMRVVA